MAPQPKSDLQQFIANVRERIIDGGRFSLAAFDKAVGDEAMQRLAGGSKQQAQSGARKTRRTRSNSEAPQPGNAAQAEQFSTGN